jgi:two-component system sensor histidine kinase BaeS
MSPSTPRPGRLSLVQQLVLLLVAGVLLAVTVLGGVTAWNLREGFRAYLRAEDDNWLDRFAQLASDTVAQRGLSAITGPAGTLHPLFDALAPADHPRKPGPDAEPPPGGPAGAPVPGQQRPSSRLMVLDLQGQLLSGRADIGPGPYSERALIVNGQTVAVVRLAHGNLAPQGIDLAFLARQYQGMLFTAVALLVLAVLGAVWVGQRWLRPLRETQQAAGRLAQGELTVRLHPRGNDEFTDLALDINAMAASLQQLEASRRRWLAELSHEMRTPLAVLRGEVEALIDGVRPLNAQAMHSLQEEVARVTRLMEDFHQLALSDLRALPCNFRPTDPLALVQQTVARFAPRAQAAGLQLDGPTGLPAAAMPRTVQWDPERIQQLLDNLMENSLRYTDAPGRMAVLLAVDAAGRLELSVQDSAPGVPTQELARVFEPLYRADPSRSRRSGGSGLGLAICSAIARSHGGQVQAQASPWGGLRVVVSLPVQARGTV